MGEILGGSKLYQSQNLKSSPNRSYIEYKKTIDHLFGTQRNSKLESPEPLSSKAYFTEQKVQQQNDHQRSPQTTEQRVSTSPKLMMVAVNEHSSSGLIKSLSTNMTSPNSALGSVRSMAHLLQQNQQKPINFSNFQSQSSLNKYNSNMSQNSKKQVPFSINKFISNGYKSNQEQNNKIDDNIKKIPQQPQIQNENNQQEQKINEQKGQEQINSLIEQITDRVQQEHSVDEFKNMSGRLEILLKQQNNSINYFVIAHCIFQLLQKSIQLLSNSDKSINKTNINYQNKINQLEQDNLESNTKLQELIEQHELNNHYYKQTIDRLSQENQNLQKQFGSTQSFQKNNEEAHNLYIAELQSKFLAQYAEKVQQVENEKRETITAVQNKFEREREVFQQTCAELFSKQIQGYIQQMVNIKSILQNAKIIQADPAGTKSEDHLDLQNLQESIQNTVKQFKKREIELFDLVQKNQQQSVLLAKQEAVRYELKELLLKAKRDIHNEALQLSNDSYNVNEQLKAQIQKYTQLVKANLKLFVNLC